MVRSCAAAASGTSRCATPPDRGRAAGPSSTAGGFGAFTTNFEDLGGLRQLPGLAVQRLMADGYGFGGEGDWKTALLLRALKTAAAASPAAPRSWRTTPTTSSPAGERSSARTCSRSAPASPPRAPSCEIHPLGIGGREDPVRLVFDAAPGPALVAGLADLGDRFAWWPTRSTSSPRPSRCPSCRWRARCGGRGRTGAPPSSPGSPRAPRTTPCCPPRWASRWSPTSPTSSASNCSSSTPRARSAASSRSCAGTRPTTGWPAALDPRAAGRPWRHGPRARRMS